MSGIKNLFKLLSGPLSGPIGIYFEILISLSKFFNGLLYQNVSQKFYQLFFARETLWKLPEWGLQSNAGQISFGLSLTDRTHKIDKTHKSAMKKAKSLDANGGKSAQMTSVIGIIHTSQIPRCIKPFAVISLKFFTSKSNLLWWRLKCFRD